MQTINRNNYEEFFLLYADNELDIETKLAVENFVQQNADLAVELQMLIETKSLPEEIEFVDKEILLRTEGVNINENNYEEYFLLYIDNELSLTKREEVEMYVLQHPKLQKEFTGLKQAVLAPEIFSYGSKEDLYRTEKKRTVYMRPWRFAAAAAFIGICALGWWIWQKPEHIVSVAVNQPTANKTEQNITIKPVDTVQQRITNKQEVLVQQTVPSTQNKIAEEKSVAKKKPLPVMAKTKQADIAVQHTLSSQQQKEIDNIVQPDIIIKQNKQPITGNNDVAIEHNSSKTVIVQNKQEELNPVSAQDDENAEMNGGYKVYNVAYKEINTDDNNNSLHVGAFDLNKNKVKNLFKKASRLFGNKQDNLADDNGKLHVANFEIQTNKQ